MQFLTLNQLKNYIDVYVKQNPGTQGSDFGATFCQDFAVADAELAATKNFAEALKVIKLYYTRREAKYGRS